MTEAVILFLVVALLLYVIFGGADFGAGILELFKRTRHEEKIISHALAPVWEANHVWLILVVVILFTGFPELFRNIVVLFHIPLLCMLIGIVCRGTAFTFRHYDPFDDRSHVLYSRFFIASSILTPFSIGVVLAGMTLGRATLAGGSFYDIYIASWFLPASAVFGVFICCLFTYVAAAFLVEETAGTADELAFVRRFFWAGAASVVSGLSLLTQLAIFESPFILKFFSSPVSLSLMVLATLGFGLNVYLLRHRHFQLLRVAAAAQVGSVFLGWFWPIYPEVLVLQEGSISLLATAAPPATMRAMLIALVVGSALIFPALFYLMRVFKIAK